MKTRVIKLIVLSLFVLSYTTVKAQNFRQNIWFNDGWKFHKGDTTGAELQDFNDANWRKITLPHDWSIEGTFDSKWASSTAFLPTGIGWYRKTFNLDPNLKGKNIVIYFDGVYKNSEVWINGHYLGKRPSGFVSFYYDITPYVIPNGQNTIAVKVDHSEYADSRWYTGSGIYRNVHLIATNKVHFDVWGLNFETLSATAENASVKVAYSIKSDTETHPNVTVKTTFEHYGKIVLSKEQSFSLNSNQENNISQSIDIANPLLWSVDNPNRYILTVSLYIDGKLIDEVSQNIGIRTAVFDKDKGFSLNGKSMKLKGVCIHDDAGSFGVAVPAEVWECRLTTLKEAGVNSLRLSHNPHADFIYDLCDELGLLVMDEAFDEWEIGKNKWIAGWNVGTPGNDGYHEYFKDWADRDLSDMIKRDRIHPSIIMWSIGNEIDYPNDPYTHPILNTGNNPQIYGKGYTPGHPPASEMTPIAKHLVSVVKRFDTTRPVTAALAGVVMSNEVGYPDVLDAVGYNYQEFRYAADHQKYPNRIIYGSENSMQSDAWDAVLKNDFIAGQYLWTGVDYMGEANKWPARSSEPGLLDLAGFKKPEFYFRQSLWTDQPMVYIGVNNIPQAGQKETHNAEPNWNFNAGEKLRVSCYTNCDEVELLLNGQSLGKKALAQSPNKIMFWDVAYQPGELLAKAYKNGSMVKTDTLFTTGPAVAIKSTINFFNVDQIELRLVDKNGHVVYNAENEITVTLSGQARGELLGLESGNATSHEDYKSNTRKAYHGKLVAYIEQVQSGNLTVTFSTPGLKSISETFSLQY